MTLFASLAIVLVAGSAFAFFNGEPKVEKPALATQVYYHVGSMYIPSSTPPAGKDCQPVNENPCFITLTGTSLPSSFSEGDLPLSNPNYVAADSPDNGRWQ